jgi:hypothetical protein
MSPCASSLRQRVGLHVGHRATAIEKGQQAGIGLDQIRTFSASNSGDDVDVSGRARSGDNASDLGG